MGPRGFKRTEETRTLNGRHHRPFEVRVYVYVLGLLGGHGGRGHHHPRGLYLGRHVHALGGRGVVRVLQGEQRLQLLLLEQTSDGLRWRRRWRRRRLRLRRRDYSWRVRLKTTKKEETNSQKSTFRRRVREGWRLTDLPCEFTGRDGCEVSLQGQLESHSGTSKLYDPSPASCLTTRTSLKEGKITASK